MGGGHHVKQPLNQMGCMELIRVDSRLERRLAAAGCPTRRRYGGSLFLDIAEVKRASRAPVTYSKSGSRLVGGGGGGRLSNLLNIFQIKMMQFQPEAGSLCGIKRKTFTFLASFFLHYKLGESSAPLQNSGL